MGVVEFVFPPPPPAHLPVAGSSRRLAVNRIFCVGRNYAEHAAEMGAEVDREAPFWFLKSPHAVMESGGRLAYPPGTADLHHEIEMVVALGAGGFRVPREQAAGLVWGYGAGLDMTRRDLQARAKDQRRPWDMGKDFEGSAVLSAITPMPGQVLGDREIGLAVNGVSRQRARLSQMVWPVDALVAHLSRFYHLRPGDLIMTGTPAGVGPVGPGDRLTGGVEGLAEVTLTIDPPE